MRTGKFTASEIWKLMTEPDQLHLVAFFGENSVGLCGVQPMTGPTGLIFAMRTKYAGQNSPLANQL